MRVRWNRNRMGVSKFFTASGEEFSFARHPRTWSEDPKVYGFHWWIHCIREGWRAKALIEKLSPVGYVLSDRAIFVQASITLPPGEPAFLRP